MAHHDTKPTSNQGTPTDQSSQQGSGDMTGHPDQGGTGQTGLGQTGDNGQGAQVGSYQPGTRTDQDATTTEPDGEPARQAATTPKPR